MDYEDSRNALFVEPNAYIQRYETSKQERRKIIFQEPYECYPNHYINNGFKSLHKKEDCFHQHQKQEQSACKQGFDIKNLTPILGLLGGNNSSLKGLTSMLGNFSKDGELPNMMNIVSGLLSNKEGLANLLNIFKGSKLNNTAKEIPTTEYQIKNYTKVE